MEDEDGASHGEKETKGAQRHEKVGPGCPCLGENGSDVLGRESDRKKQAKTASFGGRRLGPGVVRSTTGGSRERQAFSSRVLQLCRAGGGQSSTSRLLGGIVDLCWYGGAATFFPFCWKRERRRSGCFCDSRLGVQMHTSKQKNV
jgi:hypothetical protein